MAAVIEAPEVDFGLDLLAQCEGILQATRARESMMRAERRKNTVIRLHDGHMALHHIVRREDSQRWEDVDNDTGPGTLVMDYEWEESQWLWDMHERKKRGETINVIVTVDYVGTRWSGLLHEAIVETDDLGNSKLTATFLSDYEQLKWRDLWSNPGSIAGFQFPKIFALGGPADWALGTALHLNLARAHGWVSGFTDDPLNASATADQTNWPIVVKPDKFSSAMARGTTWAIVLSRFATFHEAAQMILEDAELSVTWRRWLEGDPLPWAGARIKHGTLVIGFEDKSGILEGTAGGGTMWDGLSRVVRGYINDFIENDDTAITGIPSVPEYHEPGFIHTDPRVPYVFFGPKSPGLLKQVARWRPAKGLRITTGGHSMPMVNELISAALQAAGDMTAMIPGVPPLGGAAEAILRPIFEDVILSFMSVWLAARAAASGEFALYEYFIADSGKAYTLASLLVMRSGVHLTRTSFSVSMEIGDGGPYLVGAKGHGHFGKGDRVLTQIIGDKSGRIHSERVRKTVLSASVGSAPAFAIEMGDSAAGEDPAVRIGADIERLKGALKTTGVM